MKRHVLLVHEDPDGKRKYIKEHVDTVHEGKKLFKCDYCEVRFGRKRQLKRHVSVKHKNTSTK